MKREIHGYEYILTNKESEFYNEDNFKEDYKFKVIYDITI